LRGLILRIRLIRHSFCVFNLKTLCIRCRFYKLDITTHPSSETRQFSLRGQCSAMWLIYVLPCRYTVTVNYI
jgi:hypothetical protein